MKRKKKSGLRRAVSVALSLVMAASMVVTPFAASAYDGLGDVSAYVYDPISGGVRSVYALTDGAGEARHWFYDQLSAQGRRIYDALSAAYEAGSMADGATDVDLSEGDVVSQSEIEAYLAGERTLFEDFAAAKDAFDLEHPEAWYVDSAMLSFRVSQDGAGRYHAYVGTGRSDTYYVSGVRGAADVQSKSATFESVIDDVVAGARAFGTDAERVKYVHDRVTHGISYRFETDCAEGNAGYVRTAYALVTHEGVCEGYARSFQYAMNKLGIPCVLIHGIQTSGVPEDHMWAAVYLTKSDDAATASYSSAPGGWYVVDATWDDPVGLDKNGNIKTTGVNGDDGGETETYLMVGQDVVGKNWKPSGYVSTGGKEFEYPEIAQISYNSTVLERNGLTVVCAADVMEDVPSTVYHVSFNGDGLTRAAEKGYYFLVKMYDVNADGSVDEFDDWYYSVHGLHAVQSAFDPDNDFRGDANPYFGDTDEYLTYNVLNCEYVEFAITTKAPPDWRSAEDLLTLGGYYDGDGTDILAETGLIFNERGGYEQPPYISNASPGLNRPITINGNQHMHVEFTDPLYRPNQDSVDKAPEGKLNDAADAMNQDVVVDYTGMTGSWGMNQRQPHKFAEKHDPTNIRWTCAEHGTHAGAGDMNPDCRITAVDYDVMPSSMWADDAVFYEFYLTGLVGVKSNKFPNGWAYEFVNRYPYTTCSIASGFWWSLWGQPQLLDSPADLDLDQIAVRGVDGNEQSLADLYAQCHLDPFDMNGRLMLVAENLDGSRVASEELADAVENSSAVDVPESAVLSRSIFEIDFARICKETIVETGQSVRLCIGFPEGFDASMAGVVFKAYHFTRDIEGSCPYGRGHEHTGEIISVEEIPITVTPYGLVVECRRFSPFEIVALDASEVPELVDDTKTVVVAAGECGKILLEDGTVAVGGNGNVRLTPGQSVTLKVQPDEGKVVDFLAFDGHEIVADETGTLTISYEDLEGASAFVTAAFVDETVVQRDEDAGMTRVVADASNENSSEAPSHLTAADVLHVGASAGMTEEDGWFEDVQDAIDYIYELEVEASAKTKWTIEVEPGDYGRFVVFPGLDGLTLRAKAGVTVSVLRDDEAVIGSHDLYGENLLGDYADGRGCIILAKSVTVDGFTFDVGTTTGVRMGATYASAIQCADGKYLSGLGASADGLVVRNCAFEGRGVGAAIYLGSGLNTYTVANNVFDSVDKAVAQVDASGAPKRVTVAGNEATGCDYFYYNYFTATTADGAWDGVMRIDRNVVTGTELAPCAIAIYDMSAGKELGTVSVSGNTFTHVEFIQFGLDAHEAVSGLFENNVVKTQLVTVGIDESSSVDGAFDIFLTTRRTSPGAWALCDGADDHPFTGKITFPGIETGITFSEYVQCALDAANAKRSDSVAILSVGLVDDDAQTDLRAAAIWVHENVTWVPGDFDVKIPEVIDPGFGVDPVDCDHVWSEGFCEVCGEECEHGEFESFGEDVAPTCTESGSKPGIKCSICGLVTVPAEVVPAAGHRNVVEAGPSRDATCTEGGLTAGEKCGVCGEILAAQVPTPALGHEYGEDGRCARCDSELEEPCEHENVATRGGLDATCTELGYSDGEWCEDCETWVEAPETIDPLGHDERERLGSEPTCTEAGSTDEVYCIRCDVVLKPAVEIAALGHDYVDGVCERCGAERPGSAPPSGPDEPKRECDGGTHVGPVTSDGNAVAATCSKSGLTDSWSCESCGEVVREQKTVAATGEHDYKNGACSVCGAKDPNYKPAPSGGPSRPSGSSSSSSSSSGSSSSSTYRVSVDDGIIHGEIKVGATSARRGATVKITVLPDEGYEIDGVSVTYGNKKLVEVKRTSEGVYTFSMPAANVTVSAKFVEEGSQSRPGTSEEPVSDGECPSSHLTDVPSDVWYHDAVDYMIANGVMAGVGDGKFAPGSTLTRGMVVTMLYGMAGRPATAKIIPFADVDVGAWYSHPVIWAYVNEIVSGYDDAHFGPNDDVTREQLAAILFRYSVFNGMDAVGMSTNLGRFEDADQVSDWAVFAMEWAVANHVVNGTSETTLSPKGTATRAEAAQMLYNYCTMTAAAND